MAGRQGSERGISNLKSPIARTISINNFDSVKAQKDEMQLIRKKPKLELRDGIIVTLDNMKRIEDIFHNNKESAVSQSKICARDLLIVVQGFDNFENEKVK